MKNTEKLRHLYLAIRMSDKTEDEQQIYTKIYNDLREALK